MVGLLMVWLGSRTRWTKPITVVDYRDVVREFGPAPPMPGPAVPKRETPKRLAPMAPAPLPLEPTSPKTETRGSGDHGDAVPIPVSRIVSLGNPAPQYPASSLEKGQEGTVVLKLSQRGNGSVDQIEVVSSSGFSALDRAAVDAAARWKLGGTLPPQVSVPIRFRIEDGK